MSELLSILGIYPESLQWLEGDMCYLVEHLVSFHLATN